MNIIRVQLQGQLTGIAIRSVRRKKNPIYDQFYQNMLKVFFIVKINKMEHYDLWNDHQNGNVQA